MSVGYSDNMSDDPQQSRRLLLRHTALTLAIFGPLLLSFIKGTEFYPLVVYRMFYGASRLGVGTGYEYYIFRGETISGEVIDIPPVTIVNALDDKIWSIVSSVVNNDSFRLRSPHPDNTRLIARVGGVDQLPGATRLPDLLRAWGNRYNAILPEGSPHHLRRVRLDAYEWPEKEYANYSNYIKSWSVEL
jgi:hypothetical protein